MIVPIGQMVVARVCGSSVLGFDREADPDLAVAVRPD